LAKGPQATVHGDRTPRAPSLHQAPYVLRAFYTNRAKRRTVILQVEKVESRMPPRLPKNLNP
jgi:hypothetical protein